MWALVSFVGLCAQACSLCAVAISYGLPRTGLERVRISAHVDVWKNNERGEKDVLVKTTRPCAECGLPLTGLIVAINKSEQAHAACRGR